MQVGVIHAYPNEELLVSLSGYVVHLFVPEKDAGAMADQFSKYHHVTVHAVYFEESNETINKITEIAKKHQITCFLPLYEGGIIMSSLVSLALKLPFYSLSSAVTSRNKYYLKLLMQSAFLATPESVPVFPYTPYQDVRSVLGERIVLKVVDSMNSQAVIVVDCEKEYQQYLHQVFHYLNHESPESAVDRNRFCYGRDHVKVIAQEFCDGVEVNLDVLVRAGQVTLLGIFEKARTKGPFFPESMSFYPSTLTNEQQNQITETAKKAVQVMQISNGVAHIEIRYKEGKPKLLDMGLRPGGAFTIKAIKELYSVDLVAEIAKLMTGEGEPAMITEPGDLAVLYGGIIFPQSGQISGIEGFDKLVIADLKELRVLVKEGSRIVAPPFSAQPHLCYYYLQGDDPKRLYKEHCLIQQQIKFQIE